MRKSVVRLLATAFATLQSLAQTPPDQPKVPTPPPPVTAENSVIGPDFKVFGYNNLYVAGSSVFPSGGYANPTLTIVALALRLAETIAKAA